MERLIRDGVCFEIYEELSTNLISILMLFSMSRRRSWPMSNAEAYFLRGLIALQQRAAKVSRKWFRLEHWTWHVADSDLSYRSNRLTITLVQLRA
jgi:hypothetical protein